LIKLKIFHKKKKTKPEIQKEIKSQNKNSIDSFEQLLNICNEKKEVRLKYELEKNVNLVNFEKNRIEISFNPNLDKNFVKDLSLKLFEWTEQRWIITLSKTKGEISIKEKEQNKKKILIDDAKESELYKTVLEKFEDANLINVMKKNENNK
jgi:DNA polymerase-3 subunit gamma/tau